MDGRTVLRERLDDEMSEEEFQAALTTRVTDMKVRMQQAGTHWTLRLFGFVREQFTRAATHRVVIDYIDVNAVWKAVTVRTSISHE